MTKRPSQIKAAAHRARGQLGRKRDAALDARILEATLDVLAQVGASGLTMDLVAARAGAGKAAIYRRWTSKSDLIIEAVAQMKARQVDLGALPDSGSLRDDLLGLFKPLTVAERERRLKIMAALASLLAEDEKLAEAANAVLVEPWAKAYSILMHRARDRGEIPDSADISTLARVIPSMAAYRALVERKPFELNFLTSMLDGVVLPALGIRAKPQAGTHLSKRVSSRKRSEP